jgi:hypothetical protein
MQKETKSLLSYGRRIESLHRAASFTLSRLRVQCIQHRNSLSIGAVRRDYESTIREMGRQPTKQLQVFPVSASVYLVYQDTKNENRRHFGFPNREDTRIPALRDWITTTTLHNRERCAQAFLDEVDLFLSSNQDWILDKFGDSKISSEQRALWEPRVVGIVVELEEVCLLLNSQTFRTLIPDTDKSPLETSRPKHQHCRLHETTCEEEHLFQGI